MSNAPASPQILTPVADEHHDPPQVNVSSDSDERPQPVSLLTALIQSSDRKASGTHPPSSGIVSTRSSAPSTAFSSPRTSGHGILQQSKATQSSILRRESNSGLSDEGQVGLGLGGLETLASRLEKVEEKRERIGWAEDVDQRLRSGGLKFAVTSHPKHSPSIVMPDSFEDDDEDIDDGYQEDEEDGFDSDNSQDSQIDSRFPFARPTNFDQHPRFIGSTHIPMQQERPAPALLPPPARRGRGHIRVDEESTAKDKTCSRHRSPPPARSRSPSRSAPSRSATHSPNRGRLSDAGPREGRAGSPMPFAVSSDSDDEEEEEEEVSPYAHAGWRSDDAVFYGPKARQVTPIPRHRPRRHSSALDHAVFVDSDDEEVQVQTSGIGDFLRRASEHIPGFRRPSSGMFSSEGDSGVVRTGQPPCPPALDNTPAMAQSKSFNDTSADLTHRLETALSIPSAPSSAAVSRVSSVNRHRDGVTSPVTIQQSAAVRSTSAQSAATAQSIPAQKDGDQLGWTDEALLKIRKSSRA